MTRKQINLKRLSLTPLKVSNVSFFDFIRLCAIPFFFSLFFLVRLSNSTTFAAFNDSILQVDIPRTVRTVTLSKKFQAADIVNKWNNSTMAKRLANQQTRRSLGDFERFQLMVLRKKVGYFSSVSLRMALLRASCGSPL